MSQDGKTATIWSQTNCQACSKAKMILESLGYTVDYRTIDTGTYTKKDLFEVLPNARSVPQIFIGDQHVGGLGGLEVYLMNKK